MAWSLIAAATGVGSVTLNTTGASLIVVEASYDSTLAVSDNKGNGAPVSLTPVSVQNGGDAVGRSTLLYYVAPVVGSGHTFTISISYASISVAAFAGNAAAPFDVESAGAGVVGAALRPGSATASVAGALFVTGLALGGNSSAPAIDSGFAVATSRNGINGASYGGALAYKVQTTAGPENPLWTWTTSASNRAGMAVFKPAVAAPALPTLSLPTFAPGSITSNGFRPRVTAS